MAKVRYVIYDNDKRLGMLGKFCHEHSGQLGKEQLGNDHLNDHLVFTQRFNNTLCFHKIETVPNTTHGHYFRLYGRDDLTEELKEFMKMAYKIGTRQHLEGGKKK